MDRIRSILAPTDVNFVIYHSHCTDGFASALCADLYAKETGTTIRFYPAKYLEAGKVDQTLLDQLGKSSRVLIVDFSYPLDFMQYLQTHVTSLILLDHHATAEKDLKHLPYCLFDMKRSGATLAWDYFFGNQPHNQPHNQPPGHIGNYSVLDRVVPNQPPRLFQYIEDRDLWTFSHPESRDFCAAFYSMVPFDFYEYASFLHQLPNGIWVDNNDKIAEYIEKGRAINQYITSIVNDKIHRVSTMTLANGKTVALLNTSDFISELGEALGKIYDYALLFNYDISDRIWRVSLRAKAPEICQRHRLGDDKTKMENSCGDFARKFGGGGHPAAAGFVWKGSIPELTEKLRTLDDV